MDTQTYMVIIFLINKEIMLKLKTGILTNRKLCLINSDVNTKYVQKFHDIRKSWHELSVYILVRQVSLLYF